MKYAAPISVIQHLRYLLYLAEIIKIDAERSGNDPLTTDVTEDIENVFNYHLDSIDRALERR